MTEDSILKLLPGFIPRPKKIIVGKGNCDLSKDVRLTTNNVLPLQRKTMRSVFNAAGIKVVANKKKYIIEAIVDPALVVDPAVPDAVRNEYYEIEFTDANVFLRSVGQDGVIWGSFALAGIYESLQDGMVLPNMVIRDWPSVPVRGIYLRSSWGMGMMDLADWTILADMLASTHFNRIFLELYASPRDEMFMEDGLPLLMTPFADDDKLQQLKTEFSRQWYSPRFDLWKSKKQHAFPVEKNNLQDLFLALRERGMGVIPTFSLFADNRGIPQMAHKLAAHDAKGVAKTAGFCLSNELTLKFLDRVFASLFTRYFDGHPEMVCLRLDDGFALASGGNALCDCPKCSKNRKKELPRQFAELVAMLRAKGAKQIIITDSVAARAEGLLSKDLVAALAKLGITTGVLLLTSDAKADTFGLPSWQMSEINAPGSLFHRNNHNETRNNLKANLKHAAGSAVVVLNYTPLEHEQILVTGELLWNAKSTVAPQALVDQWEEFHNGKLHKPLRDAQAALYEAISAAPESIFVAMPFDVQVKAFQKDAKGRAALRAAEKAALKGIESLRKITDPQEVPGNLRPAYSACRAQCALFAATVGVIADLAEKKDKAKTCETLSDRMEFAERQVPEWMTATAMHRLSALLQTLQPPK